MNFILKPASNTFFPHCPRGYFETFLLYWSDTQSRSKWCPSGREMLWRTQEQNTFFISQQKYTAPIQLSDLQRQCPDS